MTDQRPLDGRVAIVTGAGRGIGRGEAVALAAAGAKVVVNDVGNGADGQGASPGPADEVVGHIRSQGGEAVACYESVADWEGAARVVATAVEHFGRLDVLVNNAGIVRQHKIEEVTEEDFDLTVDVNLKGTFAMCRAAVPVMREHGGGRVINTCSNQWAAPIGNPEYAASKGGVVSLTYELAWELDDDGITVNAIAPFALTRMTRDAQQRDAALVAAGAVSERRMKAKEARADAGMVAPIVVYLASDAAAEVTGCVFRAGGGKVGLYSHPVETRTVFRDEHDGPWSFGELADLLPRTVLSQGTKAPHIL
ncbi:SDR family NAD(P)-dependent oxidoreductase [Streptomyces sp. NRRL S-340]|uniref:SDR family NAD(P)-dependent oxidoreductase n=1 Tax=Streptomyces sp. NRRL S-340 TaxID=1463901 RepID=UPI000562B07B|nr:SDR family NAD(P)-dependent oxidoreductase [Streptomyces sp. NRRL S-340]